MSTEAKPLIVIVEDEVELASVVSTHLEQSGMQTQICTRAAHALRYLQKNYANLILLDLNLPDQSGFSLLQELKDNDIEVPTIFVTGNSQEPLKIQGLEMGGDDYVTKPFSYPELIARIRAVLRRTDGLRDQNVTKNARVTDKPFEFAGATIKPDRLEILFPDGATIVIGKKELGILAHLHSNPGAVITRSALIHAVWGVHADVKSRSLDQYIVKIRTLFSQHGLAMDCFTTIHGVGYRYQPTDTKA